jgi:branched-chain amino acid transport system permease protein
MTWTVFFAQLLNGVQLGLLLFLFSAGLTLIFGIMHFVNLAHGSLFMIGAYVAAETFIRTGSFVLAGIASVGIAVVCGFVFDRFIFSKLYLRSHLDQVLATFGLILIMNEIVRFAWGPASIYTTVPEFLSGTVSFFGITYPAYRLAIITVALLVGLGLYLLIHKTRAGTLIRAGASNPGMVAALGVNIRALKAGVIMLGAALAAIAGFMAAPISSVQPGMGEPILIVALVVIVIGGIGSVRGAFYGAIIVGLVDTMGRVFIPLLLREFFERSLAQAAGPAISSTLTYILLALVLAFRPQGLFPVKHG